mmetsp:Transcript_16823/g.49156  ORF Transcript_16823/g.49156 Transcript_16823/m.49156 type:complete len:242 (-) Transcript_16823:2430-3155(-)
MLCHSSRLTSCRTRSMVPFRACSRMARARMSLLSLPCLTAAASCSSSEESSAAFSASFRASLQSAPSQGRKASPSLVRSRPGIRSTSQVSRRSGQILMKGRELTTMGLFRASLFPGRCKNLVMSSAKPFRDVNASARHLRKSRAFLGPKPGRNVARGQRCIERRSLLMFTPTLPTASIMGTKRARPKRSLGTEFCSLWSLSLKRPFSSGDSCQSWHVSAKGSCTKRAELIAILCSGTSQSR